MSRYLLLVLLNIPLVIAGIVNAVVSFKLGRSGRRRFVFRIALWLLILASLVFAKPIYDFMFSNNLTQTEPLSLFDVIQITGIIIVFFIANQAFTRTDLLERRVQDLHQELSIRLAKEDDKDSK